MLRLDSGGNATIGTQSIPNAYMGNINRNILNPISIKILDMEIFPNKSRPRGLWSGFSG